MKKLLLIAAICLLPFSSAMAMWETDETEFYMTVRVAPEAQKFARSGAFVNIMPDVSRNSYYFRDTTLFPIDPNYEDASFVKNFGERVTCLAKLDICQGEVLIDTSVRVCLISPKTKLPEDPLPLHQERQEIKMLEVGNPRSSIGNWLMLSFSPKREYELTIMSSEPTISEEFPNGKVTAKFEKVKIAQP